jgi:hypothetical protein
MVRSWVLLSAILATVGVALAGCAAPFSRGYYAAVILTESAATIAASGVYGQG